MVMIMMMNDGYEGIWVFYTWFKYVLEINTTKVPQTTAASKRGCWNHCTGIELTYILSRNMLRWNWQEKKTKKKKRCDWLVTDFSVIDLLRCRSSSVDKITGNRSTYHRASSFCSYPPLPPPRSLNNFSVICAFVPWSTQKRPAALPGRFVLQKLL